MSTPVPAYDALRQRIRDRQAERERRVQEAKAEGRTEPERVDRGQDDTVGRTDTKPT